ncbi:heme biosynthesis operon protein HemX, partial [Aeromonas hydrophila]
MTAQQESQVTPQPTAVVNGSKSRSGAVLGGVAILLALGLTGGLYLHGHKNAVAQQAELAQLKQQLANAMSKIDQSNSKDAEQLAALGQT